VSREDGFTLAELLVACAGACALIAAALAVSSRDPGAESAARSEFAAANLAARELAATTGDGATLSAEPAASGTRLRFWRHRPIGTAQLVADPRFPPMDLPAPVGFGGAENARAAFVLYYSSSGTVSARLGSPATRPASEPPCPGGSYRFSVGAALPSIALDCATSAPTLSRTQS
jgi:hypothetical protein